MEYQAYPNLPIVADHNVSSSDLINSKNFDYLYIGAPPEDLRELLLDYVRDTLSDFSAPATRAQVSYAYVCVPPSRAWVGVEGFPKSEARLNGTNYLFNCVNKHARADVIYRLNQIINTWNATQTGVSTEVPEYEF